MSIIIQENTLDIIQKEVYKFSITDRIKSLIQIEAEKDRTIECCGYWIRSQDLIIPATNTHAQPDNNFSIDGNFHASMIDRYSDAIIYHSHLGEGTSALLSHQDIESSKRLMVPYLAYHVDFKEWDYFDPANLNPYPLTPIQYTDNCLDFYMGIPWQWDRFDCYSLFRNYYQGMLGIKLRDFSRKGEEGIVTDPNWNQYTDNYISQGFLSIPLEEDFQLQKNDVMLMSFVGEQLHHALIVVDTEDPEVIIGIQILGEGRVSERVSIGQSLIRRTKMIIRHNSFI